MVEIAIMGYGVVGSGVAEVLLNHTENIAKRAKEEIRIKYILDLREFPGDPLQERFTKSFDDIVNDPDVKIVVEVMGGLNPSYDYVRRCLLAGKSVVTSNKELVAAKGAELLALAQKQNLNFLFEASVGGGIPIIRPMSQCLAANDVIEIAGILNGTTNFILTKMIRDQMDFTDALSLAQQLGYAERSPEADVEGHDACRKICILASLAFGKHVYPEQVHTEGITKVSLADVEYANVWGGVIKLIGRVKILENEQVHIIVCPMMISRDSQLATVDDVFNGILVRGDSIGDVVFYGKGAGKLPTASAVVADVIDCVRHFKARKYLFWDEAVPGYVRDYREDTVAFYVRAKTKDSTFALGQAEDLFGDIRQLVRKEAGKDEIAFVTEPLKEEEFLARLETMKREGIEVLSTLRIGEF